MTLAHAYNYKFLVKFYIYWYIVVSHFFFLLYVRTLSLILFLQKGIQNSESF
jgi:hypothetical protein